MPARADTILILGGTAEAVEIALRLHERPGYRVITALAGRTAAPRLPEGETRIGGFGGVLGLHAFIELERVRWLVDATHPFATTISANAGIAAERSGIPLFRLVRPPWSRQVGDDWRSVATTEAAADALPAGARAFLALGRQHLRPFEKRRDVTFVVRVVDEPENPTLNGWTIIAGKPNAKPEDEARLFKEFAISHLVCRNAGGRASYAKLVAARAHALPVVMIDRPAPDTNADVFSDIDALLAAIP